MLRHNLLDAQAALGFMVNQASIIETEVYRQQYPEIQYPLLVPVDDTGPEWAKSITFFSVDHVGQAAWFHHMATDMRLADISRTAFQQGIEMAGIGYRYTLEEIGQAVQMGMNLTSERAAAAVQAYEQFVDQVAIAGDVAKNWAGLINSPYVSASTAQAGVGGIPWAVKTSDEILRDINAVLTGIWSTTNQVEVANTILLPPDQYMLLATKRLADTSEMTLLQWITQYNAYTAQSGQPLLIRAVRQLDNAGAGVTDRMMAYRRDPSIVRIHIPMRHRFLPVWQTGPIVFDVPGIFRLGGTEIRRPAACRYLDGI